MKISLLLLLSLAPAFAQAQTPKPEPPKAPETAPVIPDRLIAAYFKADSAVKSAQIALQSTQQYIDLQAAQKAQGDTVGPIRDACGTKFDVALGPDKMTPICVAKPPQPPPNATTPSAPPADAPKQ